MAPFRSLIFALLLSVTALLQNGGIVHADNPVVQTIYTADPAPIVHDGRFYIFAGHDADDADDFFKMRDWQVFSTDDMANWKLHESPLTIEDFGWAAAESAWASQVIHRNNNFYFYVTVRNAATGGMAIGVAISDSITGPYVDALGGPLLENGEIDPTVYIDDDGQAYMYWGNPGLSFVRLNEDMVSFTGDIVNVDLTTEGFGTRLNNPERPTLYEEGPWVYKRNDLYYMVYAADCCSENIQYSTGPTITGPWTYRGILMDREGGSWTNHAGIVDYMGRSYFVYHNAALPGGHGYKRSVAVEEFEYNSDGTIPRLTMTSEGPRQIKNLDPYVRQEAETAAWVVGAKTQPASEGGLNVAYINNGAYIKVNGVDFGEGAVSFTASVSSETAGGTIELHIGAIDGLLIGNCTVENTGGWQQWTLVTCPVSGAVGTHDLFFKFVGTDFYLLNMDWWQFSL
ncbi:Arabinoxylan arabinofuranohydrolase [Colletotrichum sp. SAR 10_86]|nr:Arabinoxylan arabinofuranohydrolase [Colletotrichum sp. SAR 10_75]KAI8216097.1 Arabinoxylan arabinofuranohydrolase [Colletotrichum sp. SAR 10_77]KAI8221489.1 Arabinoxylan arabinofuranohydrolase [Colletotrichum sp. SAR 10_86]KAJ4996146.1 Arabinoxylan arabinofuranohydrolase [Colletotrichum sp. SAR 10_66]